MVLNQMYAAVYRQPFFQKKDKKYIALFFISASKVCLLLALYIFCDRMQNA